MTVHTTVKRNTCSGNPKSFTRRNTHWSQHFHYGVRLLGRDSLIHNSIGHHGLHVAVLWEVLFVMTISWQGQVNVTKVLLMYSFCLVPSIKHVPNFYPFPMPTEISIYSFQPDWLHQAVLKEYLQLFFVPILLKSLFYRNEGLKEPGSFGVDFSKISCSRWEK